VAGEVTIASRFNGPPASANGGIACGVVARAVGRSASVNLFLPPPLDTPLACEEQDDGSVRLLDGEAIVAQGRPAKPFPPQPGPPAPGVLSFAPAVHTPPPPSVAEARRAADRFAFHPHPVPTCFVCGEREDGMQIRPGPLARDGVLACLWRPDEELATENGLVDELFVWAALDCPSGFACMPPGGPSLLASMTATLEGPVRPGRDYVISAWPIAHEGRKHRGGSAIYDAAGARVAIAEALWIQPRARTPEPEAPKSKPKTARKRKPRR
jgi:hypothetical protein